MTAAVYSFATHAEMPPAEVARLTARPEPHAPLLALFFAGGALIGAQLALVWLVGPIVLGRLL